MNMGDFFIMLVAVTIGVFIALIAWSLLVKNQIQNSSGGSGIASLLSSL